MTGKPPRRKKICEIFVESGAGQGELELVFAVFGDFGGQGGFFGRAELGRNVLHPRSHSHLRIDRHILGELAAPEPAVHHWASPNAVAGDAARAPSASVALQASALPFPVVEAEFPAAAAAGHRARVQTVVPLRSARQLSERETGSLSSAAGIAPVADATALARCP